MLEAKDRPVACPGEACDQILCELCVSCCWLAEACKWPCGQATGDVKGALQASARHGRARSLELKRPLSSMAP